MDKEMKDAVEGINALLLVIAFGVAVSLAISIITLITAAM